jgi:hypothetical protein
MSRVSPALRLPWVVSLALVAACSNGSSTPRPGVSAEVLLAQLDTTPPIELRLLFPATSPCDGLVGWSAIRCSLAPPPRAGCVYGQVVTEYQVSGPLSCSDLADMNRFAVRQTPDRSPVKASWQRMPDGLLRVLVEDDTAATGWSLHHVSATGVLASHPVDPAPDGGVPSTPTGAIFLEHFTSLPSTAQQNALGWLLSTEPDAGLALLLQPLDQSTLSAHLEALTAEQREVVLRSKLEQLEFPGPDEETDFDAYGITSLVSMYGAVPGFLEKADARAAADSRAARAFDPYLALHGSAAAARRLCEGLASATRGASLEATGLDALVALKSSCEWVPEIARRDLLADAWWCGTPPTLCPVEDSARASVERVAHLMPNPPQPEDVPPGEDRAEFDPSEAESEEALALPVSSVFDVEGPTPLRAALEAVKPLPADLALRLRRATYQRLESPRGCGRYWQAVLAMPAEVRTRVIDPESPEGLGQEIACRITVDDARRTMRAVPLK